MEGKEEGRERGRTQDLLAAFYQWNAVTAVSPMGHAVH